MANEICKCDIPIVSHELDSCERCGKKFEAQDDSQQGKMSNQSKQTAGNFNLSERPLYVDTVLGPASEAVYRQEDVREFIKKDWDNLILFRMGEITWTEYCTRRIKLAGDDLVK